MDNSIAECDNNMGLLKESDDARTETCKRSQRDDISSLLPTNNGNAIDSMDDTSCDNVYGSQTNNHKRVKTCTDNVTNGHNANDNALQATKTRKNIVEDQDLANAKAKDTILAAWKDIANDDDSIEEAFNVTTNVIKDEFDKILKVGIDAFHSWELTANELKQLQEELESKDTELQRLHASEEKYSKAISNLQRAIEKSRSNVIDYSQYVITEAGLRAELSAMNSKHDEVFGKMEEYKRKSSLLENELTSFKSKLSYVVQEKTKLEREQRLARLASTKAKQSIQNSSSSKQIVSPASSSTNGGGTSDTDYYKQKILELHATIHGLNAVLGEKNRQINELNRQVENDTNNIVP